MHTVSPIDRHVMLVAEDMAIAKDHPVPRSPSAVAAMLSELGVGGTIPHVRMSDLVAEKVGWIPGHLVGAQPTSRALFGPSPRWYDTVRSGFQSGEVRLTRIPEVRVLNLHGFPIVFDRLGRVIVDCSSQVWRILEAYGAGNLSPKIPTRHIDSAFLGFGDEEAVNYCHYVLDTLTRIGILETLGINVRVLLPAPTENWQHYLIALVERHGHWVEPIAPLRYVDIDELLVADNYGANLAHPAHKGAPWSLNYLDRIIAPRRKLSAGDLPSDRIYVSRGDTRKRRLVGEDKLIALLARNGFVSVIPGSLSPTRQADLFARASVVVGPHGAGLTSVAFMRPGSHLVELTSVDYHVPAYQILAAARGVNYAFATGSGDDGADAYSNIVIDIDEAFHGVMSLL